MSGVRVLRRLAPESVVLVRATETLVTPRTELALNESMEKVGWACAAASVTRMASADNGRINEPRKIVFINWSNCFIGRVCWTWFAFHGTKKMFQTCPSVRYPRKRRGCVRQADLLSPGA